MSLHGMNGSVQSLSLVMSPLLNQILEDQEDDNYVIQTRKYKIHLTLWLPTTHLSVICLMVELVSHSNS
jgi:hypothetical protein